MARNRAHKVIWGTIRGVCGGFAAVAVSASAALAEPNKPAAPVETTPRPQFSAPIDVPASARAGAEDRARREAEEAAAAEAEARAKAEREAQRATVVTTATVMRADDKRYSITIFRRLGRLVCVPCRPVAKPVNSAAPGASVK